MTYMMPALVSAQLMSLIVFAAAARWYVIPWLNSCTRADALSALLWVQVFRYVALQVFSAQRDGFPISDGHAMEIVAGEVARALIGFGHIELLPDGRRLPVPVAWPLAPRTPLRT